jgi:rhodanese-related sulfurtransferase
MTRFIDAPTLRAWLDDGGEIALFDVREAGQFGEGHMFHAVPLPYSRLELDLTRLAPRPAVRMVLVDGGGGIAERAASRALALGYGDVRVLRGGAAAWRQAGHRLFQGVNVVSKAFGELVEHEFRTPSIGAEDLRARQARGDDLIVVDGRPMDEYRKMSIPGAVCCPNGELAYRIAELAPRPTTTIVVNCAGRTRSIIGAQTLRHFGVENPVLALRDGTMGWRLAGFELEHGGGRFYPGSPSPERRSALRRKAQDIAGRWNLRLLDISQARQWLADAERTAYLVDIRTGEEFAGRHAPGAIHAPGGQLIQATDHWLGVRGARVLLLDDSRIRAVVVALWLQRMGREVAVLDGGPEAWAALAGLLAPMPDPDRVLPRLPTVSAVELRALPEPAAILDLRPSQAYRAGHIAGARWAIRPQAAAARAAVPETVPIVLAASEPDMARAFAVELSPDQLRRTVLLTGGVADWREAGLDIAATPADTDCIDYLFFVHDRHAGNLEAARQYLAWETGLVAQLDDLERATFRLP